MSVGDSVFQALEYLCWQQHGRRIYYSDCCHFNTLL